ncbi:MAG: phosphoglycerate mutase family protein [Gemmatimonadota bacterium]
MFASCGGYGGGSTPAPAPAAAGERLIVAVRHAEKVDDGSRDPALTEAGVERAQALAALLAGAGVERVLSSDFIRTRDTAAPTATAAGVQIEIYDPRDIPGLAEALLAATERVILVVGHSNTTPALVAELTGQPADPMPEEEYDRLYRIIVRPDGFAAARVERY